MYAAAIVATADKAFFFFFRTSIRMIRFLDYLKNLTALNTLRVLESLSILSILNPLLRNVNDERITIRSITAIWVNG